LLTITHLAWNDWRDGVAQYVLLIVNGCLSGVN